MAKLFMLEYKKNHSRNCMHIRPKSVYTFRSYQEEPEERNFQRYVEANKLLEGPNEQWGNGLMGPPPCPAYTNNLAAAPIWRQPRGPPPCSKPPHHECEETCDYSDLWFDNGPDLARSFAATRQGTLSICLREQIRIDLTIDQAIRVINFKSNIVLALCETGSSAALMHPNGRIYQYGSRVEILAHDGAGNNKRYAKMWYKGVSFTSEQCALVYLVDSAGTRTTTDNFSDLSQDFSLSVFYSNSRHGVSFLQEAMNIAESIKYWVTEAGVDNWIVNNIRISQTQDGLVRVARSGNKYLLRTSPTTGTASLTTPFLHATASMGQTSHLFVRRGERRMHYDGSTFIVRNAGHSAGFDDKNRLKVY